MRVKEAAVGVIRQAFNDGFNGQRFTGCRIERIQVALNLAGFNVVGYEQTASAVKSLGFNVTDSYVWEES